MTLTTEPAAQPAPMPAFDKKMLTPAELHKRYRFPRARIYDALNAGELPAYNTGTPGGRSRYLVKPEDFELWLDRTFRTGDK